MPSVLIIDDELASCAPVAALLRRDGIEATCVPNVLQALSVLRRREPDLVLLDLSMPRTDGLQLLDALMDEPRFAHLKVAVFSGRSDPETVETARRLGARDFIEKGQDWEHIHERIKAQLRGSDPA